MKAVQFSEYGDPDVLRFGDVEEPHAGADQIRVAVETSARSFGLLAWSPATRSSTTAPPAA